MAVHRLAAQSVIKFQPGSVGSKAQLGSGPLSAIVLSPGNAVSNAHCAICGGSKQQKENGPLSQGVMEEAALPQASDDAPWKNARDRSMPCGTCIRMADRGSASRLLLHVP